MGWQRRKPYLRCHPKTISSSCHRLDSMSRYSRNSNWIGWPSLRTLQNLGWSPVKRRFNIKVVILPVFGAYRPGWHPLHTPSSISSTALLWLCLMAALCKTWWNCLLYAKTASVYWKGLSSSQLVTQHTCVYVSFRICWNILTMSRWQLNFQSNINIQHNIKSTIHSLSGMFKFMAVLQINLHQ